MNSWPSTDWIRTLRNPSQSIGGCPYLPVDPNRFDPVSCGHTDIANQLLNAGPNPNVASKNGDHARGLVVQFNDSGIAIALRDCPIISAQN